MTLFYEDWSKLCSKNSTMLCKDKYYTVIPFNVTGVPFDTPDGEINVPKMITHHDNFKDLKLRIKYKILSVGKYAGAFHLLEHLMFSKVKDNTYLTDNSDYFHNSRLTVNGYTDDQSVVLDIMYRPNLFKEEYLVGVIGDALKKKVENGDISCNSSYLNNDFNNFATVTRNILNVEFTEDDFIRERAVVLSEIETYLDHGANEKCDVVLETGYPYEYSSQVGNRELIEKLTFNDMLELRDMLRDTRNIQYILVQAPYNISNNVLYDIYANLMQIYEVQYRFIGDKYTLDREELGFPKFRVTTGKHHQQPNKSKIPDEHVTSKQFLVTYNEVIKSSNYVDAIKRLCDVAEAGYFAKELAYEYYRNVRCITYNVNYGIKIIASGIDELTISLGLYINMIADKSSEALNIWKEFIRDNSQDGKFVIPDHIYDGRLDNVKRSVINTVLPDHTLNDPAIRDDSKYFTCSDIIKAMVTYYTDHSILGELKKEDFEKLITDIVTNADTMFIKV